MKVAGHPSSPRFFNRVLSRGVVGGEWSEIGMDPQIDGGHPRGGRQNGLGACQTLAAELKANCGALQLYHYGKLPGEYQKFNRVQCQSCARLVIILTALRILAAFQGPRERPAPQNARLPQVQSDRSGIFLFWTGSTAYLEQ